MQVMELIKKLQENSGNRIAGAVAELPWPARRRARATRRVLWVAGFVMGAVLVAALVWAAVERCAREEEETAGLS